MTALLYTLLGRFLSSYRCELSGHSVAGIGREQNEDCIDFAQDEAGSIAVLADGVGGHNAGEVAARAVCSGLKSSNATSGTTREFVIVQNWTEELRRLVPVALP